MKPLLWAVPICMALSALVPAPAHPAITPPAQAVVDRYLDASGGRAAWANLRALHETGTLSAFGLKGTLEIWREAPDKRASVLVIGPITTRDWTNGSKASRSDPSGRLIPLDGKDLEVAAANAWFENQDWLAPDQGGSSITAVGETKDSLGTFVLLEIAPPAGRARQLYFDKQTGLLVRIVSKRDQVTVISTYSDFRRVNGWLMPFRTAQEVGAPANDAIFQVEQAEAPADIADDRFTPPAATGPPPVTWLKAGGRAHLPFDYRSHHVWLRASVNGGPPADFIFDTGAGLSVIDSAYAARIGLAGTGKFRAQGGAAMSGASFATVDRLRIAAPDSDGVELHAVKVAVVDVNSSLAPFFWRDCAGILGFNVIGQFVTRLDYDGHELQFFDPKTFTYDGKGTAVPMNLDGDVPVVGIKLDGAYAGTARVDVGSPSVIDLHTPFVRKHDLLAKVGRSVPSMGGSVGGMFQSKVARMQSIEIGPYRVASPLVGLSTTDQGALASEDLAGNLGNGVLDRFTVTLDYERRQLWLEPGSRYGAPIPYPRFGGDLLKERGEVRVAFVVPGSPAATAGLLEGDVVTAIDGTPVAALDPDQVEKQFEDGAPGSRIALTILRGGKPRTMKIRLKDLL